MKRLDSVPRHLSQLQYIALGYMLIILAGTLLLMLPLSSRGGIRTPFLTALFTATSSTCVTGLVLVDTALHWSFFGQLVIIVLIQIGGLGFVTIGIFFALIMRDKIGLRQRGLMKESLNIVNIGGVVKLSKKILWGTVCIEGLGALLLSLRFIPLFGIRKGLWYGVFHSVSAFCNAGFDLMGGDYGAFSSLTPFAGDILVNTVIMLLIIIGGIGFIVWDDVSIHGLRWRKYRLHSKIVLLMSGILIFGGGLLFYFTEGSVLFAGMSYQEKVLASLFASVSPRTAGFNTVDTMQMSDAGKLLTLMLMFIGGASGSTAGGIKVSTLFVLLACVHLSISRRHGIDIFGRRVDEGAVKSAAAISSLNMLLILTVSFMIVALQNMPTLDVLYEVTSAMSTVGMTLGITREMKSLSQLLLIILMYLGRVGGLSFALSFTQNKKIPKLQQVREAISIG